MAKHLGLKDFEGSPILKAYDMDLIKSHVEIRPYHRNGREFQRKVLISDGTPVYNSPIHSTKDFAAIKGFKQNLANDNYPEDKVNELINKICTPEFFDKLRKELGPNSVLLPMPSTSGKNKLPLKLSARISAELNVPYINDPVVTSVHKREAKTTRGLDKIINHPEYKLSSQFEHELTKYKDKDVYIVDDIFTTGQSVSYLARELESEGFHVPNIISFTKASGSFTSPKDIEKMSQIAHTKLGIDLDLARNKLKTVEKESSTIGFQMYQDLSSGGKTKLQQYKDWFENGKA